MTEFDEDKFPDLPEGWASARLKDLILNIQSGFACGVHNRDGEGIAHLRPMNVNDAGQIDLAVLKFVSSREVNRDERLVQSGDVVFNNTNSPELVGKTALYAETERRAFSNHMSRVRCNEEILNPAFAAAYLHQKWRSGYFFKACNNHVSQASVSSSVLRETPIELPPLAEQGRIVAKVEELLARVNAARERLAKAPVILKRFRQSILAAACSGQLTADWRESGGREKVESDELPSGWQIRSLRGLCPNFQYGSSQKSSKQGRIPVLRMGNLQEGKIDWSDLAYSNDDAEIIKYALAANTVLFNRTNSPELVGKTALYRGERPAVFAGYLIRIVAGKDLPQHFSTFH